MEEAWLCCLRLSESAYQSDIEGAAHVSLTEMRKGFMSGHKTLRLQHPKGL